MAARVRAVLERAGLRVDDVRFQQTKQGEPQWLVDTVASYAQPSQQAVVSQAFTVWGALYTEVNAQPPGTWLTVGQTWTKYYVLFHLYLSEVAAYIRDYGAAKTAAEKDQVYGAFIGRVRVFVLDLERGQQVAFKDFVNKNFTR